MAVTTYIGNMILNSLLRGQVFPLLAGTRVFVSLHTGDPGMTGANEVTTAQWPSYHRVDPADGADPSTGFTTPAAKKVTAENDIGYGLMDGSAPITISHFAIWDAITGGNCMIVDNLTTAKLFYPGDDAAIRSDKFTVSVF